MSVLMVFAPVRRLNCVHLSDPAALQVTIAMTGLAPYGAQLAAVTCRAARTDLLITQPQLVTNRKA
jgi:hypothetical protein